METYYCTHNTDMETYKHIVHTIQIWIRINLLYTQYDMETYKLTVHTIQIWKRINLLYTQYRYGNV